MGKPTWRKARLAFLFVLGAAGVTFETVTNATPNYPLDVIFAGCLGVPFFIRSGTNDPEDDDGNDNDNAL